MPRPKDAKQQPARSVTKGCVLQREGTVQRRGEGGAGLLEDREGAWRSGPQCLEETGNSLAVFSPPGSQTPVQTLVNFGPRLTLPHILISKIFLLP